MNFTEFDSYTVTAQIALLPFASVSVIAHFPGFFPRIKPSETVAMLVSLEFHHVYDDE